MEAAIRENIRVISDPSWQVQKRHDNVWRTIYYCSSENAAHKCLERCVKRMSAYSQMSREQQIAMILRDNETNDRPGME